MDTSKQILLAAFILILFTVSALTLFFGQEVQRFAIRSTEQGLSGKMPFLKQYISSSSYLVQLKIVGGISLLAGAFMVFVLIKSLRGGP